MIKMDVDKEKQADAMSISTVGMSSGYESPPPAYPKYKSSKVQIVRIIATTVLAAVFILGVFIVAGSYVQALAKCNCPQHVHHHDPQAQGLPQPQAHMQSQESSVNRVVSASIVKDSREGKKLEATTTTTTTTTSEEPEQVLVDEEDVEEEGNINDITYEEEEEVRKPKIPLMLNLDNIAERILDSATSGDMDCTIVRSQGLPQGLADILGDSVNAAGERMEIRCQNKQLPGLFLPGGHQQFPGGPQRFPDGPQRFPDGPQRFPDGPQRFPDGPQRFPEGPQHFPSGPRQHHHHHHPPPSRSFNKGPGRPVFIPDPFSSQQSPRQGHHPQRSQLPLIPFLPDLKHLPNRRFDNKAPKFYPDVQSFPSRRFDKLPNFPPRSFDNEKAPRFLPNVRPISGRRIDNDKVLKVPEVFNKAPFPVIGSPVSRLLPPRNGPGPDTNNPKPLFPTQIRVLPFPDPDFGNGRPSDAENNLPPWARPSGPAIRVGPSGPPPPITRPPPRSIRPVNFTPLKFLKNLRIIDQNTPFQGPNIGERHGGPLKRDIRSDVHVRSKRCACECAC